MSPFTHHWRSALVIHWRAALVIHWLWRGKNWVKDPHRFLTGQVFLLLQSTVGIIIIIIMVVRDPEPNWELFAFPLVLPVRKPCQKWRGTFTLKSPGGPLSPGPVVGVSVTLWRSTVPGLTSSVCAAPGGRWAWRPCWDPQHFHSVCQLLFRQLGHTYTHCSLTVYGCVQVCFMNSILCSKTWRPEYCQMCGETSLFLSIFPAVSPSLCVSCRRATHRPWRGHLHLRRQCRPWRGGRPRRKWPPHFSSCEPWSLVRTFYYPGSTDAANSRDLWKTWG